MSIESVAIAVCWFYGRLQRGFMPVASAIANGLAPGIVVGALYGVITGAVLVWMLNDARGAGEIPALPSA